MTDTPKIAHARPEREARSDDVEAARCRERKTALTALPIVGQFFKTSPNSRWRDLSIALASRFVDNYVISPTQEFDVLDNPIPASPQVTVITARKHCPNMPIGTVELLLVDLETIDMNIATIGMAHE